MDGKGSTPLTPPAPNTKGFRGGHTPGPNDVFIAVMGVTGSGKSSFISVCSDKNVHIGHSLDACTSTVDVYPFELSPDCTVYLIDTPGFDDTNKSDTEVLSEIAAWLSDSYKNKIRLHGIIYLHRITDVRMQGSAKKNLIMFKELCGQDALRKVVLATTMWDKVSKDEAEKREAELISTPDFWGWMLGKGSSCQRHDNTALSARRIVNALASDGKLITTNLQKQLVDEKRTLDETSAGKELQSEMVKERERWAKERQDIEKMLRAAIEQRDCESQEALLEERDRYTRMIEKVERNTDALRSSMETLIAQRDERVAAMEQQMKQLQVSHDPQPTQKTTLDKEPEHTEGKDRFETSMERAAKTPTPTSPARQVQVMQTRLGSVGEPGQRIQRGGGQFKKSWRKKPLTYAKYTVAVNRKNYLLKSPSRTLRYLGPMSPMLDLVLTSLRSNVPGIDQGVSSSQRVCIGCGFEDVIPWAARYFQRDGATWRFGGRVNECYPHLDAKLSVYGCENLDVCALGPDQSYYARWRTGSWSCWGSNEIIDAIEDACRKERGYDMLEISLGYGGSYLISYGEEDRPWALRLKYDLKGYYPKLQQFLSENQDLNITAGEMADTPDDISDAGLEKGWTPLACAAEAGNIETVTELLAGPDGLDIAIDVDARDYHVVHRWLSLPKQGTRLYQVTPLWQAARFGHTSIVRLLLASKRLSDVNSPRPAYPPQYGGETPLSIAIKEGHQETAALLARADGINPCLTVWSNQYYTERVSILGRAILNGYEGLALALLDKCDLGEDPKDADSNHDDPDDNTTKDTVESISKLLVFALGAGCSRIVQELLTKHNADVNAVHEYYLICLNPASTTTAVHEYDWVEQSPLMAASRRGNLNAVRSLLDMNEIRPGLNTKSGTAITAAAQGD
ncbi:hypothetical protein NM208_g11865 [Fusarium decemcellulare]|uniref:Uncharacterized protein n=1 Tax=Fusarium decemcellulare TaxID=57161 RepID=A0ACC1RQZ1_9HYPO|nr:hypothetical protein NM208_g11865 [Fusarium decemcellulare]